MSSTVPISEPYRCERDLDLSLTSDLAQRYKYLYGATGENTVRRFVDLCASINGAEGMPRPKNLVAQWPDDDVNLGNEFYKTPLHIAAQELKGHEDSAYEAMVAIMTRGGDPNMQDSNDETALHISARCGSTRAVRLLLLNRCNAHVVASYGTALYYGASYREIVMIFLAMGLDPFQKNKYGDCPYDKAFGAFCGTYLHDHAEIVLMMTASLKRQ